MAITIDGVTYRNLQEQVGKNAEDIASLQDTQKKIISGEASLEKATVKGPADIEGKLTAGGDAEIDGTLSLNSPDNLTFKTGSLPSGGPDHLYRHMLIVSVSSSGASFGKKVVSFDVFSKTRRDKCQYMSDVFDLMQDANIYYPCSGGSNLTASSSQNPSMDVAYRVRSVFGDNYYLDVSCIRINQPWPSTTSFRISDEESVLIEDYVVDLLA